MYLRAHRINKRVIAILLILIMLAPAGGAGVQAHAKSERCGIHGGSCQGNEALTRSMVVSILYRAEGEPGVAYLGNPFDDVSESAWYCDAAKWASANGIVLGCNGSFYPDDYVTREQLATILYRYSMWNYDDYSVDERMNTICDDSLAANKTISDYVFDNCCIREGTVPQISAVTLDIPAYSQYNMPNPYGNNAGSSFFQGSALCWATCAAMWISYLLEDDIDRTVEIAKLTKRSADPYVWNVGGKIYEALEIMLPIMNLAETSGDVKRYYETLPYERITELIDSGNPIGVGYGYYSFDKDLEKRIWRGHYVLIIGYAVVGDEQFVISVDPAGGLINTQTFSDFHAYSRDSNYLWHHTEFG